MSNSVSVIFFEKVFLFLKIAVTALQTLQPLLSKGFNVCNDVTPFFKNFFIFSKNITETLLDMIYIFFYQTGH